MSRANLQRFPCVFFIQKRPLAQTILAQAAIKTVALLRIKIAREEQGESRARSQVKRPSDAAKLTCPHWAIKSGFQRLSAAFSGQRKPCGIGAQTPNEYPCRRSGSVRRPGGGAVRCVPACRACWPRAIADNRIPHFRAIRLPA